MVTLETIINLDVDRDRLPRLIEVQLPIQIEENISRPVTRALPKHERKAKQPNNSDDVKSEETEQKQMYEKSMSLLHFLGLLFGRTMTHNWKPQRHFMFFVMILVYLFAGFTLLYTAYIHFVNGSYIKILEPLAITGLYASGLLKVYAFIKHWEKILALIFIVRKYLRPNIFGRQVEVLISSLRETRTFFIIYITGVVWALVFFVATPIMVYLATNEIIPLSPVEIIFCDLSQTSGFVATAIVQLICGCYAATSLYSTAFIFCISNYILQCNLLAEDFETLNRMNKMPVSYKRTFLKNIWKKRQDMNNYLNVVKDIYETKFFLYFCSNYLSQIICLYNITQNDWVGGYSAAFVIFLEMMFYCYMGTQVSIVDDKLCYCIYNCNWYMYDSQSQQMVCLLLHEAQQPKDLQLGSIGPLNLITGITIVKSIYSYYTVITELF